MPSQKLAADTSRKRTRQGMRRKESTLRNWLQGREPDQKQRRKNSVSGNWMTMLQRRESDQKQRKKKKSALGDCSW